eukprot:1999942-Rhodomonas_salina.3
MSGPSCRAVPGPRAFFSPSIKLTSALHSVVQVSTGRCVSKDSTQADDGAAEGWRQTSNMQWLRQVRVAFDGLDVDGDAQLTPAEVAEHALLAAMRGLGSEDKASAVAGGDADGDGVIDFAEFISTLTGRTKAGGQAPAGVQADKVDYDEVCRKVCRDTSDRDAALGCGVWT